jgi:hypothetical protein
MGTLLALGHVNVSAIQTSAVGNTTRTSKNEKMLYGSFTGAGSSTRAEIKIQENEPRGASQHRALVPLNYFGVVFSTELV